MYMIYAYEYLRWKRSQPVVVVVAIQITIFPRWLSGTYPWLHTDHNLLVSQISNYWLL